MVEPTRKRDLGQTGGGVTLLPKQKKRQALVFVSHHPERPGKLDLRSFRDGDQRPKGKLWLGPFKGRPRLIAELAPVIERYHLASPAHTLDRVKLMLRCFWRLFDRHEGLAPVRSIADITDLHGALQLREGVDRGMTSPFLIIVNLARREAGLTRLSWPVNEDKQHTSELPSRRHVALIYHYLKRKAYKTIDRIDSTLANGVPAAPDQSEVFNLLVLFLLRTGWNRSTAMALDLGTCIAQHPTSTDHHVVRAVKTRGNTEQAAIGLEKSVLSPGNLLRFLGRATHGLRAQVQHEIDRLRSSPDLSDPDQWRMKLAQLEGLVSSPWLCEIRRGLGVTTISPTLSMRSIVREMNEAAEPEFRVPETITVSDLRDAYIGFSYEYSGYSWMVAKIAAGHKSLRALKAYLRQRQWKEHGEKKVRLFGESLWTLIEQRQIVDPAILHAMVERGQITEGQVQRWLAHKDRTRVGTGCTDFRNPPRRLSPEHVEGSGCRVQRCVLCEHAIVFPDSADHLCRRLAELKSIQTTIPLTAWLESSLPEEMEITEATLNRLDPDTVARCLTFWTSEIEGGRHRPIDMEGSYATS